MNYGAGLRYEYQKTDYYEKDVLQAEQSPSYRDWIPFASIGYSKDNLNLAFSYRLNKYSPIYVMLQSSIDYDSKYEYYWVTLISSLRSSTASISRAITSGCRSWLTTTMYSTCT